MFYCGHSPIRIVCFLGLFVSHPLFAHEPTVPTSIENYPLVQINKRIYIVHGPQDLPSPQTRAFMNNPAAIMTSTGVIIVDPGSSLEIGRQLLAKIRQVTDKPVIAVFNTHVHGDHWLGNQAIREAYSTVPIYAHENMIKRAEAGAGEEWISIFNSMTNDAVAGTKAIAPNIGLKGGETIDFGDVKIRIHHTGKAHTNHDIMIEVVDEKSVFLGDIATNHRVPSSDVPQDANYKGQMEAIREILKTNAELYIPGHGKSGGKEIPEASLQFLEKLYTSVQKYYDQGQSDYEMKQKVIDDLSEYKDWYNFNEMGKVISYLYLEIESNSFEDQASR